MRQNVKTLLLSTVFITAGSFAAHAGGLVSPYGGLKDGGYSAPAPTFGGMGGSLKDAPMVAPSQTGWYIRGDIGYSHYGNVGGYIGESEMFVGSNQIGTDGTFVGDFDGSCNLSNAGDYQYDDQAYVFQTVSDADATQVLTTADDVANGIALAEGQAKVQVLDANGNKAFIGLDRYNADRALDDADGAKVGYQAVTNYTDDDGSPKEADGYVYFNNATGNSIMRFNPNSQVGSFGQRIPQIDANGAYIPAVGQDAYLANYIATGENPDNLIIGHADDGTPNAVYQSVEHPDVDGSGAGIWEVYNRGAEKWSNVAAVYHDAAGDKKVLIWDNDAQSVDSVEAGGAWGDRDEYGNSFVAQTMIDVVRGFAATLPAEFLKTSTAVATERERDWLNMAALAAGRSTCNIGRQALTSADIDDTWTIGGGVGYYFTNNWRGDLTFDYRASSNMTARYDHLDEWGVAAMTATREADVSSFVALANLYYDFGDRNGFTPYLGAGIGFSVNRMDDYTQDCYDNTSNMGCMKNQSGSGDSNTDIAAAAMVGFTQNISGNLKLDVGYRYLYMGDFNSGNELASAEAGGQGQLVLEDVTAHEVRVGLRYDFGCGTCR